MVSSSVTLLHISLLLQKSDSDSSRSTTRGGAVAKPPGAQIRLVSWMLSMGVNLASELSATHRRRAAGSQVAKPNSSRAAGAGGSSNTMLKLYTDDSPGLRVYVDCSFDSNCEATSFTFSGIHSLYSFCLCLSLVRYSSCISLPRSSELSQSNSRNDGVGTRVIFWKRYTAGKIF